MGGLALPVARGGGRRPDAGGVPEMLPGVVDLHANRARGAHSTVSSITPRVQAPSTRTGRRISSLNGHTSAQLGMVGLQRLQYPLQDSNLRPARLEGGFSIDLAVA